MVFLRTAWKSTYFKKTSTGWWFHIFVIFTPTCGNDPILTNIFSDGLDGFGDFARKNWMDFP